MSFEKNFELCVWLWVLKSNNYVLNWVLRNEYRIMIWKLKTNTTLKSIGRTIIWEAYQMEPKFLNIYRKKNYEVTTAWPTKTQHHSQKKKLTSHLRKKKKVNVKINHSLIIITLPTYEIWSWDSNVDFE